MSPIRPGQIRDAFYQATVADFSFIAAYSGFLLFAWIALRPGKWSLSFMTALLLIAGSDVMENVGILNALNSPLNSLTDATADAIRTPSLIKWGTYALVIFLFGRELTAVELKPFRRPGTGILAITLMIAGGVGFTGLLPDIRRETGLAGIFSHGHLETFGCLVAIFPLTIFVVEAWRRLAIPLAKIKARLKPFAAA
jgi:hypothetical protein